jgi:TIR domain/SIR2-like domain
MRGLVERIVEGDCVLVLGPRVAVSVNDPDRRPLDELLSTILLAEISETGPAVLRSAAELFWHKTKDEYLLSGIVRDFYAAEAAATTDFHRDLAALPFRLCINASPDDQMFNAFRKAGKQPQQGHYSFREPAVPRLPASTDQAPLVYHLFGHYRDPKSLVITEGHLIEFLVNVIKGTPALPDEVRSVIAAASSSFLFLGFGFHHWYLRVLLQAMNAYGRRSKAFEDQQFFEHPDREQAVRFFTDRLIEFRQLRWEEFAKQLRGTYEAAAKSIAATEARTLSAPSAPPAGAPKAFVSYASEDVETVEELVAFLEARGIDVWQDKQDLRAGDNWENQLDSVIRKQVHYVVVVQTPAMVRQVEGVFHREITAALRRQEGIPQFRFVVPVTMHCPLLPSLEHIHAVDVSSAEGLEELAKSILEDWQRRLDHAARAVA